ncbi:MAG: 3-oxoacyl-ACP synthase III [Bacteriovoracaceae bacterium]|nr:3-oxoacyl-ACP synthase III [Bacteriovoracaceae bacterium]
MRFEQVRIESYGYHLPQEILTSAEIEQKLQSVYDRLRLPKGRLELMTGIKQRRFWSQGTRPSELSTNAALEAFERSKINKKNIDVLIHASVCRDFLEPSTASVVHHNLGLDPKCMIFDLSNACLGVMSSFVVIANMIEQGTIQCGMVVAGENGGPLLQETIGFLNNSKDLTRKNIKKYVANLTIGSAAVAFILCHKSLAPEGHTLLGGATMTRSSANTLCQGDGNPNSLMMETDSEELMKEGVALAQDTWELAKKNLEWTNDNVDWVIGHQVGVAHEKMTLKSLKLHKLNTFATYPTLGNTGSSALPITLAKLDQTQDLKRGEHVAMLGIGSGLTSTILGVKW